MFSNISFILHKPQLSENIGACARAIKNFNFDKLILVDPKPSFPNDKILATSVGAKDIIKKSKVYDSVETALEKIDYLIATTSRFRNKNIKHIQLKDLKKINYKKKIGFLFGSEASGLSNDEINCADYLVKIPSNKKFSSLNLSHSAIIFCFELFQCFSKKNIEYKSGYKSLVAKKSEVNKFLSFIIKGLDKKGFLQPDHKRKSMIRNINNIFHRLNLSEQEIRILLGIFTTLNEFNKKT